MVCNYGGNLGEALVSGNPFDAVACVYTNAAGTQLTAVLVFGAIGLSLFIYSDSAALPGVLLLIIGGAVLPLVSPGAVNLAGVVLLLVGTAALWLVANTLREP